MAIGARLQQLIQLRGRNVNELAQQTGLSASTIYSIIRRNNQKADLETLRRLSDALEAPLSYFFEEEFTPPVAGNPTQVDTLHPSLRSDSFTLPANILPLTRKKIPLLGKIAAGEPIYANAEFEDSVESDVPCDFALRVVGDSMEPLIHLNDIVFVKRQPDVRDGQIAVVLIDDEATLKRVYHLSAGLQLVSINPNYAPMLFDQINCDTLRILGRAVAFKRNL